MRIIIAIPMRSASRRLARKLYKSDTGKPLAMHTLDAAMATAAMLPAGIVDVVAVADRGLHSYLKRFVPKANLALHNGDFENGSQRVFAWLERETRTCDYDCVIDWQADEPLIAPADVKAAAKACVLGGVITTLGLDGLMQKDAGDRDIVKAIAKGPQVVDFTRSGAIQKVPLRRIQHIGIYAFPRKYYNLGNEYMSDRAKRETLEQLTWLDAGARIEIVEASETRKKYKGHFKVDSVADYKKFVSIARAQK